MEEETRKQHVYCKRFLDYSGCQSSGLTTGVGRDDQQSHKHINYENTTNRQKRQSAYNRYQVKAV